MKAARQGNEVSVKGLLEKGAEVNAKNLNDQTALFHTVISAGCVEVVKLLVNKLESINEKD